MSTTESIPIHVSLDHSPAGWYPDPTNHWQTYWDGSSWTDHHAPSQGPVQPTKSKKRRRALVIGAATLAAAVVGLGGLGAAAVASDVSHQTDVSRQLEDTEVDFTGHATDASDALVAHDQKKVDAQLPTMTADAATVRHLATEVDDATFKHALNTEADAMDQLVVGMRDHDQAALQRAVHLSNDALKELHQYDQSLSADWSRQ